jgi:hypothetical protein
VPRFFIRPSQFATVFDAFSSTTSEKAGRICNAAAEYRVVSDLLTPSVIAMGVKGIGMAQVVLSGEELVGIVQANGWIPEEISIVEVKGKEIELKVRTPLPLFKSVRISVQFAGFEDGRVIFQLGTNRVMDSLSAVIGKMLESLRLEDYGGRWEYPCLYLAVNPLLGRYVRGIEIESINLQDGCFHIQTAVRSPAPGAATDEPGSREASRPFVS